MIGAAIRAEEDVHQRRDVGVVAGVAVAVVVPVVQLGRTDDPAQGTDGQSDIRVNVDRPQSAEGDEASENPEIETEQKRRQVDDADGVDRVERMFAMRGEPVEMFGAVMHRMEAPQKRDAMLQTMSPVNEEITQHDHLE